MIKFILMTLSRLNNNKFNQLTFKQNGLGTVLELGKPNNTHFVLKETQRP